MATLGQLSNPEVLKASVQAAADFYSKGIAEWQKTSMNNGVKSAAEIIEKFARHSPESTHAEVMLQDAERY
jgi:hypothetical protein